MNKLTLRLDDLRVDTFYVESALKQKGTVLGEQCTCHTQCTCPGCPSCAHYATCDASCNGTCGATCNASCYGTCDYSCDCGSNDSCYDTCAGSCANVPVQLRRYVYVRWWRLRHGLLTSRRGSTAPGALWT